MKHQIKLLLRKLVAQTAHRTGLRRLFRARRRGIPVLMFHNVGHPPETEYLPDHMKVSEGRLETLLRQLRRSGYRTLTVSQIRAELEAGRTPHDVIGLTFDDGYRDNHDVLLPILRKHDATATIYVQTGPMQGKLNWLHHYFWVLAKVGPQELGRQLAEHVEKAHLADDLRRLPGGDVEAEYEMKRLLKYQIGAEERDAVLARIFADMGGDDAELARSVYMGPDECRALDEAGVEIGAHTVNHLILSSLDATKQRLEIEGSLRALESWLGHGVPSFAYPYGRAWDYDEETLAILDELGFQSAITAMPGLNEPQTPRLELKRIAVNESTSLADVLCEVDGVFLWLAQRGLNLAA